MLLYDTVFKTTVKDLNLLQIDIMLCLKVVCIIPVPYSEFYIFWWMLHYVMSSLINTSFLQVNIILSLWILYYISEICNPFSFNASLHSLTQDGVVSPLLDSIHQTDVSSSIRLSGCSISIYQFTTFKKLLKSFYDSSEFRRLW